MKPLNAIRIGSVPSIAIIMLGIFDKRTNREGAIAGMLTGLMFTLFYITSVKFYGADAWLFGISARHRHDITIIVSRLTLLPPIAVQKMLEDLSPSGELPPEAVH